MPDLRYALRQLAKSPGFALTVILTLALGIGACTTVFSIVNTIVLHPLALSDPDRLVTLNETRPPNSTESRVSAPDFLDWQKQARSFASLTAFNFTSFNLTGESEPIRLTADRIMSNYFEVLGRPVALGRGFLPEEEKAGKNHVVILGYNCWQQVFGGKEDVIGRTVQLSGDTYTVVGVAGASPDPAAGRSSLGNYVAVPLTFSDAERSNRGSRVLLVQGRLKPDVTVNQAQAEMDVLARQLAAQYPQTNKGVGAVVIRTVEFVSRSVRPMLWSLLGAVGCVLLIVCANVANLLLVRATARQRELCLRAALGASRAQLVRQLFTESMVLALLGGVAGVLLSAWGLAALPALAAGLGRFASVKLDLPMLGFALGLSLLTGLLFGLAPAWLSTRVDVNEALKQGTRGTTEGGSSGRLRGLLVVLEVACAVMLLSSAALFTRSFVSLTRVNPGFDPENVAMVQLFLRGQKYATQGTVAKPETVLAFSDALLSRIRSLPGVTAAGVNYNLPFFDRADERKFEVENNIPLAESDRPTASWFAASPGYFDAMKIRLLRGRYFTERDDGAAPRVALINATLARLYFPEGDAIGRRIKIDLGANTYVWREIVGIVGDVAPALSRPAPPQVYEPFAQQPSTMVNFIIRTESDPAALSSSLKHEVYAVDPNQPVAFIFTLSNLVNASVTSERFGARLLGLFSFVALAIATVGLYGVIAYSVSRRTTEIGIRMALGAQIYDVLRLVLLQGARLVGIGLALGLAGTLVAGRWIQSQLYETSPYHLPTLASVSGCFIVVALLACWLPARRATQISPVEALRSE